MERTKRIGHLEEEIESDAKKLFREYAQFTTGTRYLTLLHRQKDGGSTDEYKRRGGYYVTHTPQEFLDALTRLLILKNVRAKPYRLYVSVNARSVAKGERSFKRDMLETDFQGGENKQYFWERLPSKWVSALMQPGAREGSLFLLDIDGEGDVSAPALIWLANNDVKIHMQYATPNGWHIITDPFNPTLFDVPNCEIKKDALMLFVA